MRLLRRTSLFDITAAVPSHLESKQWSSQSLSGIAKLQSPCWMTAKEWNFNRVLWLVGSSLRGSLLPCLSLTTASDLAACNLRWCKLFCNLLEVVFHLSHLLFLFVKISKVHTLREIDTTFEYGRISCTVGILHGYRSGRGRDWFIILRFVSGHCLRKTSRGVSTSYRFGSMWQSSLCVCPFYIPYLGYLVGWNWKIICHRNRWPWK